MTRYQPGIEAKFNSTPTGENEIFLSRRNHNPNHRECLCCCKEKSTYGGQVLLNVIRIKDFLGKIVTWSLTMQSEPYIDKINP